MDKKSTKLENLKKKQDQLKAQIQKLEAAEKHRERKKDTRRKILIGSYYLEQAREKGEFQNIVKLMESYLKRDTDRVLFDLEPLNQ